MLWYIAALIPALFWLRIMISGMIGGRRIPFLKSIDAAEPENGFPKLSVVIPARNEGAKILHCLESLLTQDYPDLEIIFVNDRSTDETGSIADELAAKNGERLVVDHITELPDGWLGKCHALAHGASKATGDYILFTDGDVIFQPSALRRSMAHIVREKADMLAVLPEMVTHSAAEDAMILVFALSFMKRFEPWGAMNHKSNRFIGVGAFNLVKRSLYIKCGGHRFLRLQVIDDVGLGKLIKYAGGVVRVALGSEMVKVRWQDSLQGHIRGLEKNLFAGMNYNTALAVIAPLGALFIGWWPIAGLFGGPLWARIICAFVVFILTPALALGARRITKMPPLTGFLIPVGMTFMAIAIVRSTYLTLRQGGIYWRDTFYPLKDLRRYRI